MTDIRPNRMRILCFPAVVALLAACGGGSGTSGAEDAGPGSRGPGIPGAPESAYAQPYDELAGFLEDERNTMRIFEEDSESVVFITNSRLVRNLFSMNATTVRRGTGSGFLWDDKGHVVTNFHVLEGGDTFTITLADGENYPAVFRGAEPNKDIAVLKIENPPATLKPVRLGDSAGLRVGQKVLAIGNPFGLDQTLTTGVISALGREIQSGTGVTIYDVIQTDASINPGNSGGALLDSRGRLIGMNTAIISPSGSSAGIGFAVPVSTIRQIVPQIIELGRVRRAGFGVTLIPDQLARRWGARGVIIREVAEGSAAARAGIEPIRVNQFGRVVGFDLVVGIDDAVIENYDDFYNALDGREPGDTVEVRILRGNRDLTVRLTLQEI